MLVLADLRQHCVGYFPAKRCLYALGWHCTSNFLVQCCIRFIWRFHKKNLLQWCLNAPGTTLHRLNKSLCNAVLENEDNSAPEKIRWHLVLLLRQNCTGKNLLQCCLNTPWTTLHRLNKSLCNVVLEAPDSIT